MIPNFQTKSHSRFLAIKVIVNSVLLGCFLLLFMFNTGLLIQISVSNALIYFYAMFSFSLVV